MNDGICWVNRKVFVQVSEEWMYYTILSNKFSSFFWTIWRSRILFNASRPNHEIFGKTPIFVSQHFLDNLTSSIGLKIFFLFGISPKEHDHFTLFAIWSKMLACLKHSIYIIHATHMSSYNHFLHNPSAE